MQDDRLDYPELHLDSTPSQKTRHALLLIRNERLRQEELKAQGKFRYTCADHQLTDERALAVLSEEVGEVSEVALATYLSCKLGDVSRALCDTRSKTHLREELVQVAAVAAAWVEKLL